MGRQTDRLVVGLGNPGRRYANTRHNMGFAVVDRLAERHGQAFARTRHEAECATIEADGHQVVLAKPTTYMNLSGQAVFRLVRAHGAKSQDLIIVCDDIDLVFGKIKIKTKGGDGGHKGLRSVTERLGNPEYTRVRVGVGRPGPGADTTDHVLGRFSPAEKVVLGELVDTAADAVEAVIRLGVLQGMNLYNNKQV